MTLFELVHWTRRMGRVQRFHGTRLSHEETVFHHSASTALILIRVYGDLCSSELLQAALTHDLEELITGDVPAPVKWYIGDVEKWEQLEARIRRYFHIHHSVLTDEEYRMLRAADFIDATMTCLEERVRGVIEMDWCFDSYRRYAVESGVVENLPPMKELWETIFSCYQHLLAHPLPLALHRANLYNFWAKE